MSAPKDDFEEDVLDEANQYALDRRIEQEREAIRQENKKRKRDGLKPLPLPRKSKDATSAKARARVTHSDSDGVLSEEDDEAAKDKQHRYEGRRLCCSPALTLLEVILHCKPLQVLSSA